MDDGMTEVILIVGTVGLTQSQPKPRIMTELLEKAISQKYIYVNPAGQYKLSLKGQKAFKDAKKEWVAEIGYIPTGETADITIDELEDITGQKQH